jgi:uncharacterized protein
MKQYSYQGLFLSLLFIVLIYFFTRSYYSLFFWVLFGLLLFLAFLKEENRLFSWVMISFFGGNFIFNYLDKFIEGFNVDPFFHVILNQLLFILPILSICYVIKQFNKKISLFLKMPKKNRMALYLILAFLALGFLAVYMTTNRSLNFLPFFLFAVLHATLQEVMWRGILLTQMIHITNERTAIVITSIGFALNTTIFGFLPVVFLMYLSFGFIFGLLTSKFKSILPSIGVHTLVLVLFFLNGWLQLPI